MAKGRIVAAALSVALAVAYGVDLARHGIAVAWHLAFLAILVAPNLAGIPYGIDLNDQERRGSRDYLMRFRGMDGTQADRELARTRAFSRSLVALVVLAIELANAFAPRAWPLEASPLRWGLLVAAAVAGALLLGVMVFGVAYAMRHLRA